MWADGKTLDSGTAMTIDNNLTHLGEENLRHLASVVGFMNPASKATNNYGFQDLVDVDAPTSPSTEPDENSISWSRGTAMRFGPFAMPQDKSLTGGGKTIRDVVIHLGFYNAGGSTIKGLLFLTGTSSPPRHGYLASATFTDNTVGHTSVRTVIQSNTPFSDSAEMLSEPTGGRVQIRQVYLWVGFQWASDSDDFNYLDAFETR